MEMKKESLHFYKYQGTGNDFILLHNPNQQFENRLTTPQIAWLCDRRFGVGADGLMLLSPSDQADFRMIYYNSDGRESSMCGNGGRCITAFAHRLGLIGEHCTFDAIDGLHEAWIEENGLVRLKMGTPTGLISLDERSLWLDTGSPHYVTFVEEELSDWDVEGEGKKVRYSEAFAREGTNVNFVNVLAPHRLRVRTYERGVEAETLSCGTGVTACAYARLSEMARSEGTLSIQTEGGELSVEVRKRGMPQEEVFLIGPATFVFEGQVVLPALSNEGA
jgi:diaminopimelate epimerase